MRLNAKMLRNVASVNQFEYANQAYLAEGQVNEIYIQLVDLLKQPAIDKSLALPDRPLRYMPQYTTSIAVEATFPSVDDNTTYAIAGTQPFADDKSIWKFTLSSSQIPASGSFIIKITLDGADQSFLVNNAITVESTNVGAC